LRIAGRIWKRVGGHDLPNLAHRQLFVVIVEDLYLDPGVGLADAVDPALEILRLQA